jgi:hypothetical protein
MSKKAIIGLALLFIAPIIIYSLWPSDESRIKKLFREGARAVEEKNIDDLMSKVSFNYTDEHGMTYLYLKEGCQRVFKQMNSIKVDYEITNIMVKDNTASAELDIRVIASSGSDTGYVIGNAAKPAHMNFFLEKERATWLVSKTVGLPVAF